MADQKDESLPRRFSLKDISGTTIALTSLAVLSAAAVVTTPVWLWYRRKRKRTDALLKSAANTATTGQPASPGGPPEPGNAAADASDDRK